MKNRVTYYQNIKKTFITREEELCEELKSGEVLIKVVHVGICGSDLSTMELPFVEEIVLGHEWVGQVIKVGDEVTQFKIGDSATSANKIECGVCDKCQLKRGLCENSFMLTSHSGMLREYVKLPAYSLVNLGKKISSHHTLFEILAVATNVWISENENLLRPEKSIIIFGSGLLGISVGLVLQKYGVPFKIVDTIAMRVNKAKELGFDAEMFQLALMDTSFKEKFSILIDASGDHLNSMGAFKHIEYFGANKFTAIILAKYIRDIGLKSFFYFSKQASIKWIQGATYESLKSAIEIFQNDIDQLRSLLITHEFSLNEINSAFNQAQNRKEAMRVVINIP